MYPAGTTNPTSDFEQPTRVSFSISGGNTGSDELVLSTIKISSLI